MPYRRPETGLYWTSIFGERTPLKTRSLPVARAREAELRNRAERQRLKLEERERNPKGWTLSVGAKAHLRGPAAEQAQRDRLADTINKHIHNDPIGAMRLEDVTKSVVAEWLDRRRDAGFGDGKKLSNATCNRLRANLSAIFEHLIEREIFLGANPARQVQPRKTKAAKGRAFAWELVPLIIENMPTQEWSLRTLLAAYTGAREGELRAVLRENINLKERLLLLEKTKTGIPRWVPLHAVVVQALSVVMKPGDTGKLLTDDGWTKAAVRVRNALARAGIDKATRARCTFAGLRGTWATRMLDCGADYALTRLIGWGPEDTMAAHYARPSKALREAIDFLSYEPAEVLEMRSLSAHHGGKTR